MSIDRTRALPPVAGNQEDRLDGLEPLLREARGRTVLDVTSHVGTVSLAFARNGASRVDGVDRYAGALAETERSVHDYGASGMFRQCDLTGGFAAIQAALMEMPKSYDIVLFLGIYHNISRQIPVEQVDDMVAKLVDLTGDFFAVRTPSQYMAQVDAVVVPRGLTLWAQQEQRVSGALAIYRRGQNSASR